MCSSDLTQTCTRVRASRTRHEVLTGLREIGLRCLAGRAVDEVPKLATPLRKSTEQTQASFTANEQSAILRSIEAIEGTARQLALDNPTNSLCAVRSLAESVLAGPSEDNQVHGVIVDVIEPLHQRLSELANSHSLPCAEPVWFRDLDRDGYGDKRSPLRSSKQPPGYVANALDCYDENPEAKPGQTRFFSLHRGDGSFDYDCDSKPSRRDEIVSGGCREMTMLGYPTKCWADTGWVGAVPDCGQRGRWLSSCEVHVLSCSSSQEARPVQECR